MPFSQIIPPPTESKRLLYTSVSLIIFFKGKLLQLAYPYTLHIHCYPLLMQNIFRIRLLPFTSTIIIVQSHH